MAGRNTDETDRPARLRLDKWLWHARFARTRTKARELVENGHVRIDGTRVRDPAKPLKTGDILTLALEHGTFVVRVESLPDQRGSFEQARTAYVELQPGR